MADDLAVAADEAPPFEIANNCLRLHWLMNKLLIGRFELAERSQIVSEAATVASLGWLVDVAERCAEQKKKGRADADKLIDDHRTDAVVALAVERLKAAAADGSLARREDLCTLLHSWKRLTPDGLPAGHDFVNRHLNDDGLVVRLAKAAVGTTSVHTEGDFVARRERSVRPEAFETFIDFETFTRRAEDVLARAGICEAWRQVLTEFRDLQRKMARSLADDA
jgi:hypothetical protein